MSTHRTSYPTPVAAYATVHGSTAKVASHAMARIAPAAPIIDIRELDRLDDLADRSPLILFCPTYGDEELPPPIDAMSARMRRAPAAYVICEAGNYYGYDAASFGALRILKNRFERLGARSFAPHLSLDTAPRVDWATLERWCDTVRGALAC